MIKRDELSALIQSLSKSEKRYFELFCAKESGRSNYLKLFDAIEKQVNYDERAVKELFKDEKFIQQLHVTKNYLRKLILKSLRNFHAGISKDAELKDSLRNVEILYNKELYQHCKTELNRAELIAKKFELITGTIEVLTWKRRLEQTLQPHGYGVFKEILNHQKKFTETLLNTNIYWELAINTSSRLFGGKDITTQKKFLKTPNSAKTVEAKVLFYNTNYLLDLEMENSRSAGNRLESLILFLEQRPEQIKEDPGLYVSSINNLLSFYVFNRQHTEALKLIQKTKTIYYDWKITTSNRTLLKQILRTYNIELEIFRDSKPFADRPDYINSTETFVKANAQKIPKDYLISFWFQLASIHFMERNFSRSLEWINRILNVRFKNIRVELQLQAQLLNLMVHLEQQNLMVLRYYVDSTKRFMKKYKQEQAYEKILLKFFVKIGRLPLLEYKEAYKELETKLFPKNKETVIPEDALRYIDYQEWINWKLRRV